MLGYLIIFYFKMLFISVSSHDPLKKSLLIIEVRIIL